MMRGLYKIGVLAVLIAGCAEERADCTPLDPCRGTSPADLAITSVTIASSGPAHPVTGLPIVDSLRVRYVVRNLGDSIAPPVQARLSINFYDHVTDQVPAVPPRDSVIRNVTVPHSALFYSRAANPPRDPDHDRDHVRVALEAAADDPQHNNFAESSPVHLALPVLEVTMEPLNEPRVRVNDPLRLTITVTNRSPTVAARNIQLRHCLWMYDVACWSDNWTAFGNIPLPDIGPGETRTLSYTTAIPPTAMEEGFRIYSLTSCVTARADTASYRHYQSTHNGTWVCAGAGLIEVWPDYEACAPPVLTAQPVTLTAPNCGRYPPPNEPGNFDFLLRKQFFVFALDAEAGRTYELTGLPEFGVVDNTGRTAPDLDAAPARVRFAQPGRYYIIIRRHTGSFTVSAEALP